MSKIIKPIRHKFGSPSHLGHVSLPPSPLIEVVLTARVGRSFIAVSLNNCKGTVLQPWFYVWFSSWLPNKIEIVMSYLHVSSLKKCSTTAEPVSVCSKLFCIASFAVDFVVWTITCQHRIQRTFAGKTAKAFLKEREITWVLFINVLVSYMSSI